MKANAKVAKGKARRTSRPSGRMQSPPDLMGELAKAQRHAEQRPPTADEIAASFEEEAEKLLGIAHILRGEV